MLKTWPFSTKLACGYFLWQVRFYFKKSAAEKQTLGKITNTLKRQKNKSLSSWRFKYKLVLNKLFFRFSFCFFVSSIRFLSTWFANSVHFALLALLALILGNVLVNLIYCIEICARLLRIAPKNRTTTGYAELNEQFQWTISFTCVFIQILSLTIITANCFEANRWCESRYNLQ